MVLLDLCCGAGGAARGYADAGFEVVGVDIEPQPRYPFEFYQGDAITFLRAWGHQFDVLHASFPCQRWSTMTRRWGREDEHPDLITPGRKWAQAIGLPYVFENVPAAPLQDPITLCGSMFGLKVRRHRAFESTFALDPPPCAHANQGPVVGVYGNSGGSSKRDGLTFGGVDTWREAMGIDWMTVAELREAIPPAYTRWIGEQIVAQRRPRGPYFAVLND